MFSDPQPTTGTHATIVHYISK